MYFKGKIQHNLLIFMKDIDMQESETRDGVALTKRDILVLRGRWCQKDGIPSKKGDMTFLRTAYTSTYLIFVQYLDT